MSRATRSNDTPMALQIEIELSWMTNILVDHQSSRTISTSVSMLWILRQESVASNSIGKCRAAGTKWITIPDVVTLADDNDRDLRRNL